MLIRNRSRFLIAAVVMSLVCCSVKKPVNLNTGTSAGPQQTTYWVVVMWTLIGTGYMSEVCPLPIDDKESIAVAARAWGASHRGLMTLDDSVYDFASQDAAEKFRQEKRYIALELNSTELRKYLCIDQPSQPPTGYWVIIMLADDGAHISDVFPLPAYDNANIVAAAHNWGYGKGFDIDDKGAYRFTSQEEAENFRREKGLAALNLSLSSLNKYLCALKPSSSKADTAPK